MLSSPRAFPFLVGLVFLLGAASGAAEPPTFIWGNPHPQGNGLEGVAFEDSQIGCAVGLLGTHLTTSDGGMTWVDRTDLTAFSTDLHDVLVIAPGAVLAVGGAPGIFRSTDSGATFAPVANPSHGALRSLVRVSGATLSAVGDNGQVLRSTDDGATWQLLGNPGPSWDIVDHAWRTSSHGYVVGPFLLRQTTDGGATWTAVPGTSEDHSFPGDVKFLDAQNGWICLDFTTYRTTDGGASWFPRHGSLGSSPIYQEEAVILDVNRRLVVTEAEGADIWRTEDDGLHWTRLYRRDSTRGYTDIERLAGGALVAVSTDGDLLRSMDEGATWANFTESPGDGERAVLEALIFLPGGKGLAGGDVRVGAGVAYLESTDGGASWQPMPSAPAIPVPQVFAFSGDQVGLVGGYGTAGASWVSRTTDGGTTWTTQSLAPNYVGSAVDIDFGSATRCYAALYGGTNVNYVYASTDAGATWFPASTGLSAAVRLDAIDFVDALTGYVAGGSSGAAIYRTTNGGANWTPVGQVGLISDPIRGMHWFDAATGLVTSFAGIHRTTNGGATWTRVNAEGNLDLSFRDQAVGYACSVLDPVVWRTTDGGVTWAPIDLPWTEGPERVVATETGFVTAGAASVILVAEFAGSSAVAEGSGAGGASWAAGDLGPGASLRALTPLVARGAIVLAVDATRAADAATPPEGAVFDAGGRRVAPLAITASGPSRWQAAWDGTTRGRTAARGVYFLSLERGGHRAAVKVVRTD